MSPAGSPREPELRVRGTLGTDEQADLVVSAQHAGRRRPCPRSAARSRGCRATASARTSPPASTITTRHLGRPRLGRDQQRATTSSSASRAIYTQDNSDPRGGHRLIPGLLSGAPVLDDVYDSRGGLLDPEQDVEAWGVSLYRRGPALATTGRCAASPPIARTTAARRSTSTRCPRSMSTCRPSTATSRLSQELQVLYDSGPLNGLLGVYYLDANAETIFDVRLPGGVTALTFGDVDTETYARVRRLHLRLHRHVQRLGRRPLHLGPAHLGHRSAAVYLGGGGSPFFGGTGIRDRADQSDFTGTADFEEFTPRASVSFQPDRGPDDLRELFARLQGRRLRSARRLDRLPQPDRAASATPTRSSTSCRSIRRRSTATSSATAPRCSTGGVNLGARRLPRRL